MAGTITIKDYKVGTDTYWVEVFPYPASNEIDYEVWSADGFDYLFTITSDAPELSTSVLWAYIKGLPTTHVVYSSKDK